METILLLAHTELNGSLAKPALEALGAATRLAASIPGAKLVVGLVGASAQAGADQIASTGAPQFLAVTGPEFGNSRYSTDAAAAVALARAAQCTLLLAPMTSRWQRAMAGVAQRLGGKIDTHATGIAVSDGKVTVNRWYYRQRMEAVLQRIQRPWVILLDPGTQPVWQGQPGTAAVEQVAVPIDGATLLTSVQGFREPVGDAQTIRPEATLLFVTGAGWTKKQADGQAHVKGAEKIIADCLRLTRASLGSTKSLVDLGGEGQAVLSFLTHLNQVGQTGSTPRHPKGLATCCHGEEPHTVGWRFINERRAVNLDPNCGWARGKADVLYIADAFAVMTKVNELLSK
jgi:electron transfer flavoprotein alpha subunit